VLTRLLRLAALLAAVYILCLFGLNDTGLLGPDEPRYAAVARGMANSGDWVTPRLWGEPWFEKPPLLYWMTAAGFRAGLGDDLAPRLPVALLSMAFLVFYWSWLRRELDQKAAWCATVMLATSAGWLAFSQLGVTDLPLAATFSAAMLVMLPWIARGDRRAVIPAGILFGLALLAKGLVPLVLAAPLAWFGRKRWNDLLAIGGVSLLTAGPWYVLCTMRNGSTFLEEFFWRHHFERFITESLQHVEPIWFYVPVLLGGLLPWSPVLVKLAQRKLYRDPRTQFLLAWVLFGLVFLSASTNKLPGYLLPLFPAICALMGVAVARAERARWVLAASAFLTVAFPAAAAVLPVAIREGLSRAPTPEPPWIALGLCLATAVAVWKADTIGRRRWAVELTAAALIIGVAYLRSTVVPVMDEAVSTRALWREIEPQRERVCLEEIHRTWQYGLDYYAVTPLTRCSEGDRPLHVVQEPGQAAVLE